jgi:hypothetical protein
MVVIFAYIGGLIAEQTRRELVYKSGSGSSLGVNLVQPLLGARPYVDEEEQAYEEDEEVHRSRRPNRARGRGRPVIAAAGSHRRHRGRGDQFDSYRKLYADADDEEGRHAGRPRRRAADEEDDEDREEFVASRAHRTSHAHEEEPREHRRPTHARHHDEEDREEAEERPEPPARPARGRSQAEERAIQRFVERALRNYDHAKL